MASTSRYEDVAELGWGLSADDGGEEEEGTVDWSQSLKAPTCMTSSSSAFLGSEGVADEVLDGGQHAGDEVGVLHDAIAGRQTWPKQEAGLAVDEEDLLDAVVEGVGERDLAEGAAGAPGFEAPLPAMVETRGRGRA